jgi:hypothetical protein
MPELQILDSSSLFGVMYDADSKGLFVCFRDSGDIYLYYGLPQEVYNELMAAESKGAYLNQQIKGKYDYKKVGRADLGERKDRAG